MIRVTPQPEPSGFDTSVRQRGNAFLAANPSDKTLPKYWKIATKDLYAAYKGICAYTCMYFPGSGTLDHFLPKSLYRALAYEWSNYRLAIPQVNSYKGENIDIIDPFIVEDGWFVIEFPSCLIQPAPKLPQIITEQIKRTVKILRLSIDDNLVQDRCNIVLDFLDAHISLDFLSRRYPFLAAEVERQGGKEALRKIFKRRS
ncbi:MAG: hypothetical protein HY268_05120 [Deltaproteobacteria bacterium]|nr:hypothetical protein [Deltaproteobacteria bacterium]